MCELFGCPPDIAARQDFALVRDVSDYRAAKAAVDLFNQGSHGFDALSKQPGLMRVLLAMCRAQDGADVTMDTAMALAAERCAASQAEDADG